ncbi:MAG: DUF4926 domain-containing protein [Acidimicrobiales bacterium]
MRKTLASDGMEVIYDLHADTDRVEAMKAVSKDGARPDMGLAPKPYLIGSRKFWRHLGSDRLPLAVVTGTITEVYWASMGDYPMFKLTEDDGTTHDFTREGDIARYVKGLAARVERVDMPWKPGVSHALSRTLVTRILVESSTWRSDPRAPGPFGLMLLQEHQHSQSAWALRCFEHWLQIEGIDHNELRSLVDHLWDWMTIDEHSFGEWHDRPPPLISQPDADLGLELDTEASTALRQAIADATDLAYNSLFGAFDDQRHMEVAAALGALLMPHRLNIPDPSVFGLPDGLDLEHEWGPMPDNLVARWREHPLPWPNYSTVEVTTDRHASEGALRGATGAIVEVYDGAYEIEIVDEDGRTRFLGPMQHDDVRFLWAPDWRQKLR